VDGDYCSAFLIQLRWQYSSRQKHGRIQGVQQGRGWHHKVRDTSYSSGRRKTQRIRLWSPLLVSKLLSKLFEVIG
jgi:hypothetical protein